MAINNPYITQVKNHSKILTEVEKEIYPIKGKWDSFFAKLNSPLQSGARGGPIVLEIGTGLGNYFSKMVNENLGKNFVGMEIRYKRCFATAEKTLGNMKNNDNSKDNTNLEKYNPNFIVLKDYAENIDKIFDKNELTETLVFFPDPWAKKKSWLKRRLVQKVFLINLYNTTKKDGKFIFKTDHLGYFLYVLQEIENTKWELKFKTFDYEKEGLYNSNAITEFEQIFRGQDVRVCYLELIKK